MAVFQGAEAEDDQEDAGEMMSATGQAVGSMKQQDLQRTGTGGEVSYMIPTRQLEDGTRRRILLWY